MEGGGKEEGKDGKGREGKRERNGKEKDEEGRKRLMINKETKHGNKAVSLLVVIPPASLLAIANSTNC